MSRILKSTLHVAMVLALIAPPAFADEAERPVAAELKAMADRSAETMPPDVVATFKSAAKAVEHQGTVSHALNVGDTMPDFRARTADDKEITSGNLLEDGPVVLIFYRGAWCPYCNLYLKSLEEYREQFEAAGARLVAVSAETPGRIKKTATENGLDFLMISDRDFMVAGQFGVSYDVPEPVQEVFAGWDMDLASYYDTESAVLALTATYVITPAGEITYAFLNSDYKVRAEPSEVLEAIKKIQ